MIELHFVAAPSGEAAGKCSEPYPLQVSSRWIVTRKSSNAGLDLELIRQSAEFFCQAIFLFRRSPRSAQGTDRIPLPDLKPLLSRFHFSDAPHIEVFVQQDEARTARQYFELVAHLVPLQASLTASRKGLAKWAPLVGIGQQDEKVSPIRQADVRRIPEERARSAYCAWVPKRRIARFEREYGRAGAKPFGGFN